MLNDQDYELLSAYIDGALTESERTALEARLLAETELREELEALRDTVALIRALPAREAPRDFRLTRGMVQARRPTAQRFILSSNVISLVSAAAAVFLIGFSLLLLSGNRAPQTASSVAFAVTNTGFGEADTTLKTDEEPAAAPPIVDQASMTGVGRQDATAEVLNQASGGGNAQDQQSYSGSEQANTGPSTEAQETAPLETLSDGLTLDIQPQETDTETAMLYAAPAAASLLPEATDGDFYIGGDTTQASGTVALPPAPTQVAQQPGQAETGQTVPEDSSSAFAQRTEETPTTTLTRTLSPTVTVTATPTLTATATAAPTLTATPVPAVTKPSGTIDTPIIMLVAGILLLAVSGIVYARSRRQV